MQLFEQPEQLAHSLQRTWIDLLVDHKYKEAYALAPVVDAVFENDPQRALRLALQRNVSKTLIQRIREVFGLTIGG